MRGLGFLDRVGRARRGDGDQTRGHLAKTLLRFRLARLPRGAAQPVERDIVALGPVAGQQVDVFDRQIELGVARIVKFEAVVRRAHDVESLQTRVAPDPMLHVNDEIGRGQGRRLGEEVGRAPPAPGPRQAIAKNVSLGDDG